jgi:hypothetical protein
MVAEPVKAGFHVTVPTVVEPPIEPAEEGVKVQV